MYATPSTWSDSTATQSLIPVTDSFARAASSLQTSLHTRAFAPLVPDMSFGASWGDMVAVFAQQLGVLPSIFRVLKISDTHAVVVEMQVDAAGYGRVQILGEVLLHELADVMHDLMGRFAHAIIDDEVASHLPQNARHVSDTYLHGRAHTVMGRSFGVDIRTWRRRVRADVSTGRALPTRVAMERVRGEVALLVALLASAS